MTYINSNGMKTNNFMMHDPFINAAAQAIATRDGVRLKGCLVQAEAATMTLVFSNTEPTTINQAISAVHDALAHAAEHILSTQRIVLASPSEGTRAQATILRERELILEAVVRTIITGALAKFQMDHQRVLGDVSSSLQKDVEEMDEAPEEQLRRSCHNTLLHGLLFAFEAFQEAHAMDRTYYPPARADTTVGSVGWDTVVLLYFVHRIPHIARFASGGVIDDVASELVRVWRKLLIALQSVDPNMAPNHSRRRGALSVVNGLLVTLFARHNTHQCAALIQVVEHAETQGSAHAEVYGNTASTSRSILQPSIHMTSEVVTYYYYKGRMLLYEHKWADAHNVLRQAYHLLPPAGAGTEIQHRNKQRVRFFLVVAGMVCGKRVPDEILRSDDLIGLMFGPLVKSMERGDAVAFEAALELYGTDLRRRGVYLMLQKCVVLSYLMLLARVHAAMAQLNLDNSRITFSALVAAYEFTVAEGQSMAVEQGGSMSAAANGNSNNNNHGGQSSAKKKRARDSAEEESVRPMTNDRMAMWLSLLISRGHVRGYISYEHQTVVLSKKDPFPLLVSTS